MLGNENGYWATYQSDEHGFNNPPGMYSLGKVDIVMIGDSYAHGMAVHPQYQISSILRNYGLTVINLGYNGNNPLTEFATFREYAVKLKPKIILWLYYVNDLVGLNNEEESDGNKMNSSILIKYLNSKEFTQNLFERQELIDDILITNHKSKENPLLKEYRNNNKTISENTKNTFLFILIIPYLFSICMR